MITVKKLCYVSFGARYKELVPSDSGSQPILRLLVSGTKLDSQGGVEGGVEVKGDKVTPELLADMCRQAKAGTVYLIPSHHETLRLGQSVDAELKAAEDGNQELFVDFALFADNPMVPFLLAEVQRGYTPDCSVGLFVHRTVEWDDAEGGYVGKLLDGKFEHVALTRPGHAAYPDADIESVFLVDSLPEAVKSLERIPEATLAELEAKRAPVYKSRQANSFWAARATRSPAAVQMLIFDKDRFPTLSLAKAWAHERGFADGVATESSGSYRLWQQRLKGTFKTVTLTDGVRAVISKKEAALNAPADKEGAEMANKTSVALKESEDEAQKEDVKKEDEAEAAAKESESEDCKEDAKKEDEAEAKKEAEDSAEAKKEDGDLTITHTGEDEAKKEDEDEGGDAPASISMEDVRAHAADMWKLMKDALTGGGASAEELHELMQDIAEDFGTLCELIDAMVPSTMEAEAEDEAEEEAAAPPPAAPPAAAAPPAKPAPAAAPPAAPPAAAAPPKKPTGAVTKEKRTSKARELLDRLKARKEETPVLKMLRQVMKRQDELNEKLAHLDSTTEPVKAARHNVSTTDGGEKKQDAGLEETLKSISDPTLREQVSRAVLEGDLSKMYRDRFVSSLGGKVE